MVSQRKMNREPKPAIKPTKSLDKRTCKSSPTKKSRRSRGSKQSLDWTNLPCDLFVAISSRLPLKARYILGFVCTTWSAFVSTTLPPIKRKLSSPWLLSQPKNSTKFICYHIETKLSFCFGPYPEIAGKTCIGSQDGWMILSDDMLRLSFFNPFSESHVSLPSPTPNDLTALSSTKKVVFSSHPRSQDFVSVIVFNSSANLSLAFWNARSSRWIGSRSSNIYDFFRLEGSNELYAITVDAQVQMFWFHGDVPNFYHIKDMCTGLSIKKTLYWDWPRKSTPKFAWNSFMVVTKYLKGYEVSRRINVDAIDQPARADEIFVDCWSDCLCESCKINFLKLTPEENASSVVAERKKPLKGLSFFAGENQMIVHETKGFSEFQSDCVYFVDSRRHSLSWSGNSGRYDLLVLDVARKTIQEYPLPCALPVWPPPFWFVPVVPVRSKKKKKKVMKKKNQQSLPM